MIENRELSMDDYLAMLRRRIKVILIPMLLAPLVGFAVSYAFPPKYTSESVVLLEPQQVPEGFVHPVVIQDVVQQVASMQQQILSRNQLQPMIDRLGLAKGKNVDDVVADIRKNISIAAVEPQIMAAIRKRSDDLPGFTVSYTAENPRDAQAVCSEITSMLLAENLKSRERVAKSTTAFLTQQLDDAKHTLDGLDSKMADFKRRYMGQLPGDDTTNIRVLDMLNSRLDATTQALDRAQQDKAYAESMLAQQLAAWKSSQTTTNPESLQQQLAKLQSQLLTLQARYTDDYPDVIKAKNDIAQLRKRIDELNSAATTTPPPTSEVDKGVLSEPPEIRQLRVQIHQYHDNITQLSQQQKHLQEQLQTYQGRLALSPAVEEQYKKLTRDYSTAQKFYDDLLSKKSQSEMATDLERSQQGEQMRLINPASYPESPSFPVRWQFAVGGLGGGLGLGLALAFWLELRDKSIHTEQDVIAVLELPMLVSVPWIGPEKTEDNGSRKTKGELPKQKEKEMVEV